MDLAESLIPNWGDKNARNKEWTITHKALPQGHAKFFTEKETQNFVSNLKKKLVECKKLKKI
jgi:hypothetical protein